jgi:diguanylate cyclase (GGDEF) domain
MRGRFKSFRARLVIAITLLFTLLAFGTIYIQTQVVDQNIEIMRRSQRISAVQMVRLYAEINYPGAWTVADGRLRKGGRDFGDGSYITHVLADYLTPDTMIGFKAGTPLNREKNQNLDSMLRDAVQQPRQDPGPQGPRQLDRPFITATGAGIAVKDDAGLPIGWIEVTSAESQRDSWNTRMLSSVLIGATVLSTLAILIFCVIVLKLTQPIDRMAAEHEIATAKNAELATISKTDPLTGLLNRRGLEEALQDDECWGAVPSQLAMIDIDHFKAVNDSRGHDEGDKVLAAIARLVEKGVRAGDLCCRWGGEEFVIVFRGAEGEHAWSSAERLRAAVEETVFGSDEAPLRVTVTIGLAKWRSSGLPEALTQADNAMYKGKREGRNRVVLA